MKCFGRGLKVSQAEAYMSHIMWSIKVKDRKKHLTDEHFLHCYVESIPALDASRPAGGCFREFYLLGTRCRDDLAGCYDINISRATPTLCSRCAGCFDNFLI